MGNPARQIEKRPALGSGLRFRFATVHNWQVLSAAFVVLIFATQADRAHAEKRIALISATQATSIRASCRIRATMRVISAPRLGAAGLR